MVKFWAVYYYPRQMGFAGLSDSAVKRNTDHKELWFRAYEDQGKQLQQSEKMKSRAKRR
ncbi:hypothetical protein H6758_02440 [Candidatus Nomurabacteria bacterium]|nr:hypothetical protein [Candidatus Nomurabacteria bacterium]